ncbi:MAG: (d)CMP kinase [Acidimicrobiales bacterium]
MTTSRPKPLIAIDGPAGSGKSTIARAVADRLGLERLDTGAMYRAVTLLALRAGVDPGNADQVAGLTASMTVTVGDRVILNGEDVTSEIRTGRVDSAVSQASAHPDVRAHLVRLQRQWGAAHGGGVVEGRDIGTVVFPDADLKIYLTADPAERARRRSDQVRASGGAAHGPVAESAVVAELARRDTFDTSRATSPLQAAEDAIVVDSTKMSVDEVVEEVLSHL